MSGSLPARRFMPALLLLALGCVESYQPAVSRAVLDILVVDGFMNMTTGTATVSLSHVTPISETHKGPPEVDALVSITSSAGESISLPELDSGKYVATGIMINENARYALNIITASGAVYFSDSIRVRKTPPIDTLVAGISNDGQGLAILLDTHDPSGNTRYYTWDFTETYEYHAAFSSTLIRINGIPRERKPDEKTFACWRTEPSTVITLGTSEKLASDVIHRYPLLIIDKSSPKISVRYSVLVRQRAVGLAEFNYLTELRKTTENLGSIFGTLPTQVIGNIHLASNPQAPVMGYFSGAEVEQKRLFVERLAIPDELKVPTLYYGCLLETTCEIPPPPLVSPETCVRFENVSVTDVVINAVTDQRGVPIAYTFTTPECGDCRLNGGVTVVPDFW